MMEFTIGADASCTDGICGEVSSVVVDPVARAVTHLVIEPKHRQGLGRLVPLDLLDPTAGGIRIALHDRRVRALEFAGRDEILPGGADYPGYDAEQMLSWPYYSMGGMGMDFGAGNVSPPVRSTPSPRARWPCIEATRCSPPTAASGGSRGSSSTLGSRRVTHVLLQEGHLWGRKEVAIPIAR